MSIYEPEGPEDTDATPASAAEEILGHTAEALDDPGCDGQCGRFRPSSLTAD